jgi:hypothetical protein
MPQATTESTATQHAAQDQSTLAGAVPTSPRAYMYTATFAGMAAGAAAARRGLSLCVPASTAHCVVEPSSRHRAGHPIRAPQGETAGHALLARLSPLSATASVCLHRTHTGPGHRGRVARVTEEDASPPAVVTWLSITVPARGSSAIELQVRADAVYCRVQGGQAAVLHAAAVPCAVGGGVIAGQQPATPLQPAEPKPIAAALLGGTLRPHSAAARQRSQHHEAALQAHHALVAAAAAGEAAGAGADGSHPGQPLLTQQRHSVPAPTTATPLLLLAQPCTTMRRARLLQRSSAASLRRSLWPQTGLCWATLAHAASRSGHLHSQRHGLAHHACTSTDAPALLPVLVSPTPQSILAPHFGGGLSAQPLLLVPGAGGGVSGLDGCGQLVPVSVSAVGSDSGVATATAAILLLVDGHASSQLLSETVVGTAVTARCRCGGDNTPAANATDEARKQARSGGVLLAFAPQPTMLAPVEADAASDSAGSAAAAPEGDGMLHGASGGAAAVSGAPSAASLPRLQPCVAHMAHLPRYPHVEGAGGDAAEAAGGVRRDSDASEDDADAAAGSGSGSGLALRKLLPPRCHSAFLVNSAVACGAHVCRAASSFHCGCCVSHGAGCPARAGMVCRCDR